MTDVSRGKWSNWFEFIFSCIGAIVGLGNIWRFPYICYKNGGGAFLLPYVIFIFIGTFPVVFLETSASQFANLGPGKVWELCPLFRGVGIAQVIMNVIGSVYYVVIIAWGIFYLLSSFRSTLPWATCDNEWNTDNCYLRIGGGGNVTTTMIPNTTSLYTTSTLREVNSYRRTPSEEFWDYKVLKRTGGIEDMGTLRWELVLCLLGAWVLVYLTVVRGIKSSGKVMYVAATLPYLLLTILFIRGLFLPGAVDGLAYFFIPEWHKLGELSVWIEAAVQGLYSTGVGYGATATLASFNKFHNNTQRDVITIMFMDAFTSLFSGMVIFITLGYMARESGLGIDEVVSHGPGLAFIVYPEALSYLPLPQLWSVIFFLTLFTVGMDTQIVNAMVITTAITDNFPKLRNRHLLVNTIIFLPLCLLGLLCVTQGGMYVLQLIDWYATTTLLLIALLQTVGIAWFYGADRFYDDIELMLGYRPYIIWKLLWKYVIPVLTLVLWIAGLARMEEVHYRGIQYPGWSIAVGWCIAMVPVTPLVANATYLICWGKGSLQQRYKNACQPTKMWVPASDELRDTYRLSHPIQSASCTELHSMVHDDGTKKDPIFLGEQC